MSADPQRPPKPDSVQQRAADWLARRDRGFTAAEQDEYLQWLREAPEHPPAFAEQEEMLRRMMRMESFRPPAGTVDDPDLLAPPRRRRNRWWQPLLASAALLAVLLVWRAHGGRAENGASGPVASCLRVNARQVLDDGSVVELKEGSEIDVRYSPAERHIVLKRGEAYFTVAKNPARPFIVEAGAVGVRAVGTVFDVRLDPQSVEVLVTEGRVRLNRQSGTEVGAGERAVVSFAERAVAVPVERLTPTELNEALVWQKPRFEFSRTPLAVAVDEFNRHSEDPSGLRLEIGDPELKAVTIGGTLRTDDVEGFVRLLSATMGIRAERHGPTEIVLKRGG